MSTWSETISLDNTRLSLNGNLRGARNVTMLDIVGNPRGTYSADCQPVTNAQIRALLVTEDVGPFRVTGLRPAVATLRTILADVRAAEADLYGRLSSAGMLCARFVRGSTSSISNHSWGTAIDLKIDGVLDRQGDGRAQRGLMQMLPHFNRHGFFWGAAFPTEDSMHFEASDSLIRAWAENEALDGATARRGPDDSILDFGDRGAEVVGLQVLLSKVLSLDLKNDGIFGPATRAAVAEFQRRQGHPTDGMVRPPLLALLQSVAARTSAEANVRASGNLVNA